MKVRARRQAWWIVPLLSVVSLAAASDLRLVEAVRNGDSEAVRALLQEQVDVNARQGDGATALHWAVYREDLDTAELLIRAAADVNVANDLGATPLYLACENGASAMVETLLTAGANPNAALPSGETTIMTAARTGSVDAVEALLAHGANVNVRETTQGQTALMWAAAQRHTGVVEVLIEAGADVQARSQIRRVRVMGVVSRTIDAPSGGAAPPGGAGSPRRGGRDGAVVEEGGFTPLLFAARQGDVDAARLLLAAGADVNDTAPLGTSVLVVAAQSGHGALGEFLLEQGADPNAAGAGYTPLHAAVLAGKVDLVRALLAHGADPNVPLTNGSPIGRTSKELRVDAALRGATPFFLAAKFAEAEIMRVLVAGGADPLAGLDDGRTPLMMAAGLGSRGFSDNGEAGEDRRTRFLDPAQVALALGQDADQRSTMGSGIDAVKLAVEWGADVNAASRAGDTALHGAALHGFKTVAQFLVDRGARLDVANGRGQTPLMTAMARPGRDTRPCVPRAW